MGCSLVKSVFFVLCIIKRIVDRVRRRYLYTRMRLHLWLPKARKVISSCQQLSPRQTFFAGPQSGFKIWCRIHFKGQYFCFHCMFETYVSGYTKIWGEQKYSGCSSPECPDSYGPRSSKKTRKKSHLTRVKDIALEVQFACSV